MTPSQVCKSTKCFVEGNFTSLIANNLCQQLVTFLWSIAESVVTPRTVASGFWTLLSKMSTPKSGLSQVSLWFTIHNTSTTDFHHFLRDMLVVELRYKNEVHFLNTGISNFHQVASQLTHRNKKAEHFQGSLRRHHLKNGLYIVNSGVPC